MAYEAVISLGAIISIIAGIIVLVWPKSLNYVVGIWLLLNGLFEIIPQLIT